MPRIRTAGRRAKTLSQGAGNSSVNDQIPQTPPTTGKKEPRYSGEKLREIRAKKGVGKPKKEVSNG